LSIINNNNLKINKMEKLQWHEAFKIDENLDNDINDIVGELIKDYRNYKEKNNIK